MTSRLPLLALAALLSLCLAISTGLGPYFSHREAGSGGAGMLAFLLGDSRRLLANEFFAKADAYYHGGYYPGIFDKRMEEHGEHMLEGAGQKEPGDKKTRAGENDDDDDFLGPPKDWIDRFGRHFFPSKHRHLDKPGEAREVLPWLKLSAEMNPHLVESYLVAAYWLREQMGKVGEAEAFLREGLRQNPGSPELLLELGKVKAENRKDDANARNLWELALKNLPPPDASNNFTNRFLYAQILGQLEQLEERQLHWPQAVRYLTRLKAVSPFKEPIQRQIDELRIRPDGSAAPPKKPSIR